MFSANSFLVQIAIWKSFVMFSPAAAKLAQNKPFIIKHNYYRRQRAAAAAACSHSPDRKVKETKYDNCVREKSYCAKQSYTHFINLAAAASATRKLLLLLTILPTQNVPISASKSSIRRFVITEKAPKRAFSWLKAAATAFTFKTLLRHYV